MSRAETRQGVLPSYEPFFFGKSSVPLIPETLIDTKDGPTESELRDFIMMVENPTVLGFVLAEIATQLDLSLREIREKLGQI